MLAINVGPLALAVSHVLLLVSLLLAMLTGWWVGRGSERNPERQLFRLLLVALLIARLAFVLVYFEHFRDQPWRVIDIRDGGFIAWPGVLAGVLVGSIDSIKHLFAGRCPRLADADTCVQRSLPRTDRR